MDAVRWTIIAPIVAALTIGTAIGAWMQPAGRWAILAAGVAALCAVIAYALLRNGRNAGLSEMDRIEEVEPERWHELIRGTSLHLRDMHYRYSVRSDRTDAGSRKAFTAEVNTIRLGFLPVILTDNETDFQGYGYLAFVYDGRRWCGPGLPCPDGREEALVHAERHVEPADDK